MEQTYSYNYQTLNHLIKNFFIHIKLCFNGIKTLEKTLACKKLQQHLYFKNFNYEYR